jgi:outer membrane protein OmpA-like peptidoglycan-associated protein
MGRGLDPEMRLRAAWIVVALIAWGAASAFWYDCRLKRGCGSAAPTIDAALDRPILFEWSGSTPVLGRQFAALREQLARDERPDWLLEVVGNYYPAERNDSRMPDIGIARATRVRDLLEDLLPASRMVLRSNPLTDQPTITQRGRFEAVALRWIATPNARPVPPSVAAAAVARAPAATPVASAIPAPPPPPPADAPAAAAPQPTDASMSDAPYDFPRPPVSRDERVMVYFQLGVIGNVPGAEVQVRLKDMARRALESEQTVVIVGHTDNTGDEAANMAVGLARANAVRDWLQQNVEPAPKFRVESRGPSQPIVSNDTEEGRGRNRRVEVAVP